MVLTEALDHAQGSVDERVPTNMRMILILEAVASAGVALTPTEINHSVGLPKQSIHRLCATLVSEGFLAYEADGKRLRPARRLRTMSSGLLHASRIHIARHQILLEVARQVGETVNFAVPETTGMSYLDRVETGWAFRVQLPIGTHVPFYCTASGKTFLASLEPKNRAALISSLKFQALTPSTIVTAERLNDELDAVRASGYAIDREEFMEGMTAIAVPVTDDDGRFLAALAFHGPTMRLDEAYLLQHKPFLVDAAHRLARTLIDV